MVLKIISDLWKCKMIRTASVLLLVAFAGLLLLSNTSRAQESAKAWASFEYLIGDWVGEGEGQPGQGTGGFTFLPDLQNHILVRKSYAAYPATKDRPAFRQRVAHKFNRFVVGGDRNRVVDYVPLAVKINSSRRHTFRILIDH